MRRRLIAAAVLVAAGIAGIVPALADVAQPRVVSTNPADWTLPVARDFVGFVQNRFGVTRLSSRACARSIR